MDGWKTRGKRLITAEDGCHDSQQSTESSSSNSSSVMLSVSLSSHSYQEASKEAYSFRNHGGSTDISISKSFSGRLKEPVTASSESGVTAEISCKAISNTRSKNSMNIRSYHKHGIHPTSHSGERMISSALSEESQNILAAKCEQVEMGPEVLDKIKDDFLGNVSFESSPMRPSKVAAKDQDMFISQFDLNEDINENGMDNLIQPVDATKSSHAVIHVLAKAGIPKGLPTAPLKFEGGLGWKGSAETSAFCPAALSKTLDRKTSSRNYRRIDDPQGFTGVDLNVPAVEDSADNGLPTENEGTSASTLQCFHSAVGSKQAGTLGIDLNCLYEASDEFIQSSPPCESENPSLVDLNLNVNTSIEDTSNIVPWLEPGCQSSANKTSDLANPREQDSSITRNACLADFNMQQVPAYAQQYLVAAPSILQPIELMQRAAISQPRLPYLPHRLPPHSYPHKLPVYFGTTNPLPSYIHNSCTMPYMIYPHEHGIFPNPSRVHNTTGASQLVQLAHGHSASNFTSSAPKVDDKLSMSGSKIDEVRQSMFLAEDSLMDEHIKSLRQSWSATTSMKRKEPEGRFDYYQLGYRQET